MPVCKNTKYVGRDVVLEYAIGCGDVLPTAAEWKRVGAMRTKEFSLEWETADSTADDSVGALRSNLATFQSLSISGDGTAKASGNGSASLIELTKHVANPAATGGQPVVWMRMTFPDITFTAFMILTTMSRSAPYDDVVTFSLEASATESDFGLIVEDTPDANAPAVSGVAVYPATNNVAVGASLQLAAIVSPIGAPSGLTWTSSQPSVVSVTQNGIAKALATGTATITATSTATGSKTGSATITVA